MYAKNNARYGDDISSNNYDSNSNTPKNIYPSRDFPSTTEVRSNHNSRPNSMPPNIPPHESYSLARSGNGATFANSPPSAYPPDYFSRTELPDRMQGDIPHHGPLTSYSSPVSDNRNYDYPNTAHHMYSPDPYSQPPPPRDMRGNLGYLPASTRSASPMQQQPNYYDNPIDTARRQPYQDNYYPNPNSGPHMYPPNLYSRRPPPPPPQDMRGNIGYQRDYTQRNSHSQMHGTRKV